MFVDLGRPRGGSPLLDLRVVWITVRGDLGIKVDCRSDEVDMFANMLWDAVLAACNMRLTRLVFVNVVLCLQQALGFVDCSVKFKPTQTLGAGDALSRDAE